MAAGPIAWLVLENGPEFRGRALAAWNEERRVRLEFIQPGKPMQNAYVGSFNGRLRDECLNANWFTSLSDAKRKIETWRQDYNQQRPHSSLEYLPPSEFARTRAEMQVSEGFSRDAGAGDSSAVLCSRPHPR